MKTDFVVVGSGVAGLTSALTLAEFGEVVLVSKGGLVSGSSSLAQGGIAAAVGVEDTFESHLRDTLVAGSDYNDEKAVSFLVEHGRDAIEWLEKQGVNFELDAVGYSLGHEAVHSVRRVLRVNDFTGLAVVEKLVKRVRENNRIRCFAECFLLDLLVEENRCVGVRLIDREGRVVDCFGRAVVLATGGLGQIYRWTTNPMSATGDGIAAAWRAGVKMRDLEFVQFHPTALVSEYSDVLFLLSEAIRGEGAYLVNEEGVRFMDKYDSRGELASRDVVARAIYSEQKRGRVFLDIRHRSEGFLRKRFPNIYAELLRRGFDMGSDLLPVTPAAHYSCGGIAVDIYGRTSVENLFAFGEVSCSGAHGANRLASNSLLEAVVFPRELGKVVSDLPKDVAEKEFGGIASPRLSARSRNDKVDIKNELREIMWDKVGILRKKKEMVSALDKICDWEKELLDVESLDPEMFELRNMLIVARLVTEAALRRSRSLGAHYING